MERDFSHMFNFRVWILFTALVFACCTPFAVAQQQAASDRPITDKWALIVGVGEFPTTDVHATLVKTSQGPALLVGSHTNSLTYTVKDACDVRNFLIEKAGFKPSHVKLLVNRYATHDNIAYYLGEGWLQKVARPNDLVVLYFSSHGSSPVALDASGHPASASGQAAEQNNYLITYDFDFRDPNATGISMQKLGEMVKKSIKSDRVIVIADTCFSGNVTTRGMGGGADPMGFGQIAVTACSAYETSLDDQVRQGGLFTSYLLDRLEKHKGLLKPALDDMQSSVISAARIQQHEQHPIVNYSRWTGGDASLFATPTDPVD
jgi:hypothetical protein